ncbi:hypothetical protein MFIFM68171_07153 [Madurella fahalii]|uniref:F-box domain-containing protein n=1 Tax=Madurella fahalii TaxID=1157608 RepID=A0ABQ0GGS3_9PEZI
MAQPHPGFLHLPTDITDNILGRVRDLKDLANLAYCHTALHRLVEPNIWRVDAQVRGRPALYWGIEEKDMTVVRKALDEYNKIDARHLLDGTGVQWNMFSRIVANPHDGILGSPVMLAVKSGSLELLELIVDHEAKCSLDVRWCAHPRPACKAEAADLFVGHHDCDPRHCLHPAFPGWDDMVSEGHSYSGHYRLGNDLFGCQTALHWAIWAQRPDMLRCLLQRGLKAGLEPGTERIVTYPACMTSLLHTVIASAERLGVFMAGMLWTSHFNITAAHMSMLEILLDHGANPNLTYELENGQPPTVNESLVKGVYWMERGSILNQLLTWTEDEAARLLIRRGAKWWWPTPAAEDDDRLTRVSFLDTVSLRPLCAVALRHEDPGGAIRMIDFMLDEGGWDGSTQPLTDALLYCLGRFTMDFVTGAFPTTGARDCSSRIALHLISRGAVAHTPQRLEWIACYFPEWAWLSLPNVGVTMPEEMIQKRRAWQEELAKKEGVSLPWILSEYY